jgi:hypothetical protein
LFFQKELSSLNFTKFYRKCLILFLLSFANKMHYCILYGLLR